MRLLDVHHSPPPPPDDHWEAANCVYAILSHTWRDGEITLDDLRHPEKARNKPGWQKLRGAQLQARQDGHRKIWIDTCCIDKTSSAELGETINSMYCYYKQAAVCYVYLDDVSTLSRPITEGATVDNDEANERLLNSLSHCRWFKRGWTLQELIAPRHIRFYDRDWRFLGTLNTLVNLIHTVTKIHRTMLQHEREPNDFSIAQRISWAAFRETKRPEDRAYSLLGILDVNIDIRYGEGPKAFIRLQEEIIARNSDQSLFAWEQIISAAEGDQYLLPRLPADWTRRRPEWSALLAPSPDVFDKAGQIVPFKSAIPSFRMTNTGLEISAKIQSGWSWQGDYVVQLHCHPEDDSTCQIMLRVVSNGLRHDVEGSKAMSYHVRPFPISDEYDAPYSRLISRPRPIFSVLDAGLRDITISRNPISPLNPRRTIHNIRLQVVRHDGLGVTRLEIEPTIKNLQSTWFGLAGQRGYVDLQGSKNSKEYSYRCNFGLRQHGRTVAVMRTALLSEHRFDTTGTLSIDVGGSSAGVGISSMEARGLSLDTLNNTEPRADEFRPSWLPFTRIAWLSPNVVVSATLEHKKINGTNAYSLTIRTSSSVVFQCRKIYHRVLKPICMFVFRYSDSNPLIQVALLLLKKFGRKVFDWAMIGMLTLWVISFKNSQYKEC